MTEKKTAGHAHKHVASSKHHGTSKHSPSGSKKSPAGHKTAKVTTKGKHPAHAKARGFAVGDLLPVCALEAVAQWLRLAGQPVSGDEVAWLWELAGRRELSIAEALAAAARFRLAGCRPLAAELVIAAAPVPILWRVPADLEGSGVDAPVAIVGGAEQDPVIAAAASEHAFDRQSGHAGVMPGAPRGEYLSGHALILGVDVPGPHAVLATRDGWWSWGELHDPWPCRIEEAWAVSW